MAGFSDTWARIFIWIVATLRRVLGWRSPGPAPPSPGLVLRTVVRLLYPGQPLRQLEALGEVYWAQGVFSHGGYVYVLQPRLAQQAIGRLEKGAQDFLAASPLQASFLGAPNRSPDTRRALAAIFRKTNMEKKAPKMIAVIERAIQKMSRGSTVNVNEISLQMALDIVGQVLFDLELDALGGQQDELIQAMTTILHRTYALHELSPQSDDFRQAQLTLDRLTSHLLQRALMEDNGEMSLARTLHDADGASECLANVQLFLMAGSETTAAALPLLLYLLVDTPGLQAELQREADEYIGRLAVDASLAPPRLESALREVLRYCPIAPYVSRRTLDTPLTLGQYTIQPQVSLRIFIWAIHRSPHLWTEATAFCPARFCASRLKGQGTKVLEAAGGGQPWMPFGAGARVCIGQHLAWLELRLALTYFLHHFTFSKVKATEQPELCVDWEHAVVHGVKDVVLGCHLRRPAARGRS